MNKRLYILTLLLVIVSLLLPALAFAQEDELVCDAFPGADTGLRTSYYMGEGTGYFASGELALAIDSFSCVIEQIDPGYVAAYMSRAAVYTQRRAYDEALDDYTAAIERNGNLIAAYNNRGIIYAAQQEYELALADFDQVIALDSGNVLAYTNRGVIRAVGGAFEAAIADLERAIELSAIDDVVATLRDPDRPTDAEPPVYDRDHAQAFALLGIVYSGFALDNYNTYLLLTGSRADERIRGAAGALDSRFTFELRLDDGTWLLAADFSSSGR